MRQSVEIVNVFDNLALKHIFWKTKTFFKKLKHRFLVKSSNIENAPFPYKSIIAEANVKANRMGNAKCTNHKNWSLPVTTLLF